MARRYIRTYDDQSPAGFNPEAFTTNELEQVSKRFTYHPERHNSILYEAIAETLPDGRYVPFPLGEDRHDRPSGIAFRFEHENFMATFPEPMTEDTLVLLCSMDGIEAAKMIRVAHVFTDHFVTEYKGLYSHAIAVSKEKNNVS